MWHSWIFLLFAVVSFGILTLLSPIPSFLCLIYTSVAILNEVLHGIAWCRLKLP